MAFHLPAAERIPLLSQHDKIFRTRIAVLGSSVLLGIVLGVLVLYVPILYILVGICGLLLVYLLLFKLEVAIIVALLAMPELGHYNYLGGGTPFHPNGLIGIAIIISTLYFFLFHKIDLSRLRAFWPFFGFFIVCLVSLMFSGEYFENGRTVALRLAVALSIYAVLLYKLDSIKKVKWVVGVTVTAQVLPTINGLLMYAGKTGLTFTEETERLGNSGVGVTLAMILAFCVTVLLNDKTKKGRLIWGSLTALFGVGLFFSFGRSGWIGFLVALAVLSFARNKKLLLILPVLAVLVMISVPAISQRFSDISIEDLDNRYSSTLAGRIEVWQAALKTYENSPLFGVGYGVGRYRVGERLGRYATMIHNDYVSVLLDTGLVSLLLFMLWQGQWVVALVDVYRKSGTEFDQMLALGVLALLVASLVMRITDNVLQDAYKQYYVCALVAATLTLPRIRAEEKHQTPEWKD